MELPAAVDLSVGSEGGSRDCLNGDGEIPEIKMDLNFVALEMIRVEWDQGNLDVRRVAEALVSIFFGDQAIKTWNKYFSKITDAAKYQHVKSAANMLQRLYWDPKNSGIIDLCQLETYKDWMKKHPMTRARLAAAYKSVGRGRKNMDEITEEQLQAKNLEMNGCHYTRYFGDHPRAEYSRVTAALVVKLYETIPDPKDVLPVKIRKIAKPVLKGPNRSVWEQVLVLPSKFRSVFQNSVEEDPLNVDVIESLSLKSRPKGFYDSMPVNGNPPKLNVVLQNLEWRVEDTKRVLETAASKLEYRKKLDELYQSRCKVMEDYDEVFGLQSFDKFEKNCLSIVDSFLKSDRNMSDCERFHDLFTAALLDPSFEFPEEVTEMTTEHVEANEALVTHPTEEEVPVQDGNDNVKEKVSTEKTDEGVDKGQSLDKIVPISLGSTHPFDDLIDNVNFDEEPLTQLTATLKRPTDTPDEGSSCSVPKSRRFGLSRNIKRTIIPSQVNRDKLFDDSEEDDF